MLMAPEEGALSLKMLSDLSHDPIIAPPRGVWEALQAWLGTGH